MNNTEMKTYCMVVTTPLGKYRGNYFQASLEELAELREVLRLAASGKTTHFTLQTPHGEVFFGNSVCQNSTFFIEA